MLCRGQALVAPFVEPLSLRVGRIEESAGKDNRASDPQCGNISYCWTHNNERQVYSLVASRDNELNGQAAEAARRDSSDMRTIAWMTLLFLPATFIAVSVDRLMS